MSYSIEESKQVHPHELNTLLMAVGWGSYSLDQLESSIAAYPFVAHARDSGGLLVGYVSAFSDAVLSTMLGELLVHPMHQRQGLASRLLSRVEAKFPEVPVYVKALGNAKHFFAAFGYKQPAVELTAMFKKP